MAGRAIWLPCLLLFFVLQAGTAWPAEKKVLSISVEGNRRIEADAVKAALKTQAGSGYSLPMIQEDIKALYSLGYFNSIEVHGEEKPEGIALIYRVEEKPIVRDIEISGNDEIELEKIQEAITFKKGAFLDLNAIRESVKKIQDMYVDKGFYLATVEYVLKPAAETEVIVEYRIEEGQKVRVRRISFIGNKAFSADDLRKTMETSEAGWFSWISGSGTFKEAALDRDVSQVAMHYYNNGYIQVQVMTAQVTLSPDKKWTYITIPLEEGQQFTIGHIDLEGELIYKKDKLMEKVKSTEGGVFNRSLVQEDLFNITDMYADVGYAFANVTPLTRIDEARRLVDLTFSVQKGKLVYVNRIDVSGNTKTRDKVVRRELRIEEGKLLRGADLRLSRQRVYATGFFEDVNFTTAPAKEAREEKLDISIKVKEGQTGSLAAGAGFSSIDRFLFTTQASLGNFLGLGHRLSVSFQVSEIRQIYSVSYFVPYFLDSMWNFGVDLFEAETRYGSDYVRRSKGGSLRWGYRIEDFTQAYLSYRYEDVMFSDVRGVTSSFVRPGRTSSLSGIIVRDTKDHPWETTRGSVESVTVEGGGGIIGGDFDFVKCDTAGTVYVPLLWKFVFMLNGRLGYGMGIGGEPLPFAERYFVGGVNSVRGYYYRRLGPTVRVLAYDGDPSSPTTSFTIGGNKMVVFNSELLFPIIEQAKIKGLIFFDAGNAFGEEEAIDLVRLRQGWGVGFRWFTPIAPFRFEWGFPIKPLPGELHTVFEFSIGTFF